MSSPWLWLLLLCSASFFSYFYVVNANEGIIVDSNSVDLNLRDLFYYNFIQKCSKYNFITRFQQLLENPNGKYIIFTYHDKYLRNGGFGDRMGGLLTATALALKYNRTLIIKANNGMHDLFKPYHPLEVNNSIEESTYSWKNWKSWSGYDPSMYSASSSTSLTSDIYKLDDCVSNTEAGFSISQTLRCAMMDGDVGSNIIKYTSNRAYLCLWNNKNLKNSEKKYYKAYEEFSKELGLSRKANLFEVGGCLLRLVMWPSTALWEKVDEAYERLTSNIKVGSNGEYVSIDNSISSDSEDNILTSGTTTTTDKNRSKSIKKIYKQNTKILSSIQTKLITTNYTLLQPRYYQIGLHFRCGDIHSYKGLYLHSDEYDRKKCIYNEETDSEVLDFESIGKSRYLNAGNPYSIAMCSRYIQDYYKQYYKQMRLKYKNSNSNNDRGIADNTNGIASITGETIISTIHTNSTKSKYYPKHPLLTIYTTSDNYMATKQLQNYTNYINTLVSPQGCHIELDSSKECYLITTIYWFLLSLSDKLIIQTFGNKNLPTSAFTRFGGMYSLMSNYSFHSGRYCDDKEYHNKDIAIEQQGNWFCKV
jgi:hypothetical protein